MMTTLVRNLLTQMTAAKDSMAGLQKKGDILIHWRIGHIGFTGDILIIIELCIYVCSCCKYFN